MPKNPIMFMSVICVNGEPIAVYAEDVDARKAVKWLAKYTPSLDESAFTIKRVSTGIGGDYKYEPYSTSLLDHVE